MLNYKNNLIKKLIGLSIFNRPFFLMYITMGQVEGEQLQFSLQEVWKDQIFSNPLLQVLI